MGTTLLTRSCNGFPIRNTNSTDAGYPTRVSTVTEPTGLGDAAAQTTSGVYHFTTKDGGDAPNSVELMPFGTDTANQTFKMRILGWTQSKPSRNLTGLPIWHYRTLAEFLCTLGASTTAQAGATGGIIGTTNLFCDTISIVGTSGNDDISLDNVSPADDTPAHVILATKGVQAIEIIFDRNSSAASCNCMVRPL